MQLYKTIFMRESFPGIFSLISKMNHRKRGNTGNKILIAVMKGGFARLKNW